MSVTARLRTESRRYIQPRCRLRFSRRPHRRRRCPSAPLRRCATAAESFQSQRFGRPRARKLVVSARPNSSCSFRCEESNLVGRSDPHSNTSLVLSLRFFLTLSVRRHARICSRRDFSHRRFEFGQRTVINDDLRLAPRQPRALRLRQTAPRETTLHFLVVMKQYHPSNQLSAF